MSLLRTGLLTISLFITFTLSAKVYKLNGKIGGKYPIVIELEEHDDGFISGKYAYKSTLQKSGDGVCSWLDINPSYDNPGSQWTIRDCKPEVVETWYGVKFDDGKRLTARMKNKAGKTYDVVANVVATADETKPLDSYFKSHIGEMVCDFDMFNDLRVKTRLINMMGNEPYFALKEIYQTQGDIEYSKGMFWGSGFMAHQCCDPATVWAYDTHNNSFYVWIRKDGREYWWSESGSVPLKFQEIVSERF